MAKLAYPQLIIVFLLTFNLLDTLTIAAQNEELPEWNPQWSYYQELPIPISTNSTYAHHQPIDMEIIFKYRCWSPSINETSIRILCLYQDEWYELESQIYRLVPDGLDYIKSCSIVFLIPEYADGTERYFMFYHDKPTAPPEYIDHVDVKDMFYSYSPFPEITAEAQYFGIVQDGDIVYGIGQEGQLLDRAFSQIVIKQQPQMKEFEVLNSDQIVSFAFSYYYGGNEEEESATDQKFITKEIWVDGNLMTEFGVISESNKGDVRTSAIYKYYYTPTEERRISVRVRHEFLDDATVQGKINIDGRFGTIISIKSRNPRVERMNAGTIFPYIHYANEQNVIEEYQMNQDPESKQREWIIDYLEDADIGPQGWLAYGDGATGRSRAIIFHSNKDIVQSGTDEHDGIQIKVAEREYFDFLGTEVDYASINFGRNSYEKGSPHDLIIPKNYVVEFDAELYAIEEGGYRAVQQEATIFQELIKYRHVVQTPDLDETTPRYDLMVVSHFGGTHLSYPLLAQRLNLPLPTIEIELYQDTQRIRHVTANRSATQRSYGIFHNLPEGLYLVKVFWRLTDSFRLFNGATVVRLYSNKELHVFCTWQRRLTVSLHDQYAHPLSDIEVQIIGMENFIYSRGRTNIDGKVMLYFPYTRHQSFTVQALYNEIRVFQEGIPRRIHPLKISGQISLHNLTVNLRDTSGLPPGIALTPLLIPQGLPNIQLNPEYIGDGSYKFYQIPEGHYQITVNYGKYTNEQSITLTEDTTVSFFFSAVFDLIVEIYDNRGIKIQEDSLYIIITRDTYQKQGPATSTFSLPPAIYGLEIFNDNSLVATKTVELTSDKITKIITSITPPLPLIVTIGMLLIIGIAFISYIQKRLNLTLILEILFITILIIALMQPWWILTGDHNSPNIIKTSIVYVNPPKMIEEVTWDGKTIYDLAELPELFINAMNYITGLTLLAGLILSGAMLAEWYVKTRYAVLLLFSSLLVSGITVFIFFTGMDKLTEVSIGPVMGSGASSVIIENTEYSIASTWGFNTGFYLIFIAMICGCIGLIRLIINWWITQRK